MRAVKNLHYRVRQSLRSNLKQST